MNNKANLERYRKLSITALIAGILTYIRQKMGQLFSRYLLNYEFDMFPDIFNTSYICQVYIRY